MFQNGLVEWWLIIWGCGAEVREDVREDVTGEMGDLGYLWKRKKNLGSLFACKKNHGSLLMNVF